jgi:hypothetical protein
MFARLGRSRFHLAQTAFAFPSAEVAALLLALFVLSGPGTDGRHIVVRPTIARHRAGGDRD